MQPRKLEEKKKIETTQQKLLFVDSFIIFAWPEI